MVIAYDIEWKFVEDDVDKNDLPREIKVPFDVYKEDGYCGVVDYIYKKYHAFANFLRLK